MTDFGDWEPSDSFDTSPADPVAVARLLVVATLAHRTLAGPLRAPDRYDDLPAEARALFAYLAAALGPLWRALPGDTLARVALDLLRYLSGDASRPRYDDLRGPTAAVLGVVLTTLRARLIREGGV